MKVLILSDERYKAVIEALRAGGSPVAKAKPLKLPAGKELHRMARNGETPEAFALLRDQNEAIADAAAQIRGSLHRLLIDADEQGVKPGALARWSGLSARRVHQITREGGD